MPNTVIRPQAHSDIDDQFRHFSGQSIDLALRFFDAVHATIARLAESADLGIIYEFRSRRLKGIRWWKVRGFQNHLVFYRPIEGGVEVLRVLHATRDIPFVFDDNS